MNISEVLDRPIAYHRALVTLTGSVTAAVMLSQALYWSKRATLKDNWFYKSQQEWQEETGLTRYEQESARKKANKYLKTELRGLPAILHYKVNEEALIADLFAIKPQTSMVENPKLESDNPANIQYTENTTEITSNNIAKPKSALQNIPKTEDEKEIKREPTSRFVPPTLEEFKAYFEKQGFLYKAEQAYKYYEVAGWRDSTGRKVKNWQQKALIWCKKDKTAQTNTLKDNIITQENSDEVKAELIKQGLIDG